MDMSYLLAQHVTMAWQGGHLAGQTASSLTASSLTASPLRNSLSKRPVFYG
jgi:hypothetical protein